MALQLNVMTDFGILVENCYARIDTVSGNKDNLTFSLNSYTNQQAFIDGKSYLAQQQFSFVPSVEDDSANFIKQGYEHLKVLPGFSEAIDL